MEVPLYSIPLTRRLLITQTFYEDGPEAPPGEGGVAGIGDGGEVGDTRVFPMEKLTTLVGAQRQQLCKTLIHLVMADSAYVENTEQGGWSLTFS